MNLGQVEKEIIDLTKWPCKFANKGCKFGSSCRFSHSAVAAKLSNVGLSAGRRLPLDELDHQLNERFLWHAGTKDDSRRLAKGKFGKDASQQSFCESLGDALGRVRSCQGAKHAMLCRVVCGTPDETPASPKARSISDASDCVISKTMSSPDVTVLNPSQVYPEFSLELYSDEDLQMETAAIAGERFDDGEGPFKFSEFVEFYGDEDEAFRKWESAVPAGTLDEDAQEPLARAATQEDAARAADEASPDEHTPDPQRHQTGEA